MKTELRKNCKFANAWKRNRKIYTINKTGKLSQYPDNLRWFSSFFHIFPHHWRWRCVWSTFTLQQNKDENNRKIMDYAIQCAASKNCNLTFQFKNLQLLLKSLITNENSLKVGMFTQTIFYSRSPRLRSIFFFFFILLTKVPFMVNESYSIIV